METRQALALLAVVVLPCTLGQNVQYRAPKCEMLCSEGQFEKPLPLEPDDEGTSAHAWSIVLLNQIKDNPGALSPPGVGRVLGIFSSCLHDAAALGNVDVRSAYSSQIKHTTDFDVNRAIAGSAFEALESMFGEFESFQKVSDFLDSQGGEAGSGDEAGDGGEASSGNEPSFSVMQTTQGSPGINATVTTFSSASGSSSSQSSRSFLLGRVTCKDVIRAYTLDGFDTLGRPNEVTVVPPFEPFNDPQASPGITDCPNEIKSLDRWQPLCIPVAFRSQECKVQDFVAPSANSWHTYALPSGDSVRSGGPPLFEGGMEEEWLKQVQQVIELSGNLSDITKMTAEHWADGPDSTTPPGHWYNIALDAAMRQDLDVFDTARLLFLVGNALNDAGVAAWDAKLQFDSVRPITMIQCGFAGRTLDAWIGPYEGVGKVSASLWQPYQDAKFVTPAFSGYVSGHSTFSAAAAGALSRFLGERYVAAMCRRIGEGESLFERRIAEGEPGHDPGLTDVPNEGPETLGYAPATDVVLCWDTWEEAAEEAGVSRLYGGIHIIADHTDGKGMGLEVADMVYEKASALWS